MLVNIVLINTNSINLDLVYEGKPKIVQSSSQVLPNSNKHPVNSNCFRIFWASPYITDCYIVALYKPSNNTEHV
jgi:hypothetical protein